MASLYNAYTKIRFKITRIFLISVSTMLPMKALTEGRKELMVTENYLATLSDVGLYIWLPDIKFIRETIHQI